MWSFSLFNTFWQKKPGVWCRTHVASMVCNLVQFAMYQKTSCMIVEKLDGHCEQALEPRKFLRMHRNLRQLKGRNCWNKMAFAWLTYVWTFTSDLLFLTVYRMPLWQYASQIYIRLYPGMERTLPSPPYSGQSPPESTKLHWTPLDSTRLRSIPNGTGTPSDFESHGSPLHFSSWNRAESTGNKHQSPVIVQSDQPEFHQSPPKSAVLLYIQLMYFRT